MNHETIKANLETKLPGIGLKLVRESLLVENPADLPKVASALKELPDFEMDYLSSVTGADYLDYLESVYHFYSMSKKIGPVALRVRVKKDNPKIPSLFYLFRSAEFQEREAYDMYGITYEGHPDPRRLFMWEGFEGFPMRKDYIPEDAESLEPEDLEWLAQHDVNVTEEMWQKAREPKAIQKPKTEL